MSMSVWPVTCRELSRYLSDGTRLDHLLERLPETMSAADRARCRFLLYGTLRHLGLLDAALSVLVKRKPRALLRAILLVGAFEQMERPETGPAVVHHAVATARLLTSEREAGLVNAVLRRVPEALAEILADDTDSAASLARRFSHPEWLVRRWLRRLGTEHTRQLLEWDQRPAEMFARRIGDGDALPPEFEPTQWPGFYRFDGADWAIVEHLLAEGRIYIQDPATVLAPECLGAQPGETILDLCAAPGGKSLRIAEAVGAGGRVISCDLAGPRMQRLRENAARYPGLHIAPVEVDLRQPLGPQLAAHGLPPGGFAGVLIDVPCSNTGVLQHRVDVKWRLRPDDIRSVAATQRQFLANAASVVAPGGRLVYSTCSLEPEENEEMVARFVEESSGGFALEETVLSRPWESQCDGAGVFRLRRLQP